MLIKRGTGTEVIITNFPGPEQANVKCGVLQAASMRPSSGIVLSGVHMRERRTLHLKFQLRQQTV